MSKLSIEKSQKVFNRLTQTQNISISKKILGTLGEGDKININYAPVMVVNGAELAGGLSTMEEAM